jgi:hypothetical protein
MTITKVFASKCFVFADKLHYRSFIHDFFTFIDGSVKALSDFRSSSFTLSA